MNVGIIGYGRFGKLAARYLARRTNVFVFDTKSLPRRFSSKRIRAASLQEVSSQEVIVLAVPVSSLQQTLRSIRPFLRPKTLVVDVCAVKASPVLWMKKLLPRDVYALATHPLFGPDSAHHSIGGHRVYISPVRIPKPFLRHVIRLLKAEGLVVNVISPDRHDRMMAETLFVTQFVGRLVGGAALRRHENSTKSYSDLMKLVNIADNDTRELFRDMVRYNRHAKKALRSLVRAENKLLRDLI